MTDTTFLSPGPMHPSDHVIHELMQFSWLKYYPCRICKKYIVNISFIQKTMLELFTQLTFTCLKSTKETLEKRVKYVHVNDVFLVFVLLTLNIFHTFS